MRIAAKTCRYPNTGTQPGPKHRRRGGHLASRATSVEKHMPHTLTQLRLARSHARHEHETKPKPISWLGSAEPMIFPQHPMFLHPLTEQRRLHWGCARKKSETQERRLQDRSDQNSRTSPLPLFPRAPYYTLYVPSN